MSKSLVNGVFWSAVDRFAVVAIQVIFEVLLARILLPADYGLIGMVAVFIAIAQVFVDGGFMNALIQKQNRTETDYSTVFYTTLVLSLLIYVVLFFTAPLIAIFYNVPQLTLIVRLLGLNVIFNSLTIVYRTKLSVAMDFKLQARFSVISVLLSGIFGLWLATKGFGVWALVVQLITFYLLNSILFIVNLKWWPIYGFSYESFRSLFAFGSKLLAAGVINAVYNNLYNLIIGKFHNASDLGIYTKSTQFTLYPSSMLTNTLQRVLYPYLSQFQDNNERLFQLNKQYCSYMSLLFFPLFVGLAILAEPFIILFLTDTWAEAIPVIQVLAFTFLMFPFINVNMYVFQIKGLSTRFLLIEIFIKVIGVVVLLVTLRYGMLIMCYGLLVLHVIQLLVTSFFADKAMQSKSFSQIRQLFPLFAFSVVIFVLMNFILPFLGSYKMQFFMGILMVIGFYAVYFGLFMRSVTISIKNTITKLTNK